MHTEIEDEVLADLNDMIELVRTKNVEELYKACDLGHVNQVIQRGNFHD